MYPAFGPCRFLLTRVCVSPEYWSGLLSGTDFTGQKLQRCLDIIHGDIVSIWNIKDPSDVSSTSYQITSFKSESRHYSTWRVTVSRRESPVLLLTWLQTRGHQRRCNSCPPLQYISLGHQFGRYHANVNGGRTCHGCCTPLSIAITCVGSAVIFAKWVSGVYQNMYVSQFFVPQASNG